jgi:hypothetical protein
MERRLVIMRKLCSFVIVLTLSAFGAFADDQSDHLEHLRAMLAAMSSHGPVVPQPETIIGNAVKTFNISARQFRFDVTPSPFVVNQGDVVTLNISVPATDGASNGHGFLMDTYVPSVAIARGQSANPITFTATTAGTFAYICTIFCGTGHSTMGGQFIVNAATNPPPSISSIFPTSGSTAGGTTVIISGSNFQTSGTTIVKFDTSNATNVNVTSPTSISVVTPAHAAGTVAVMVTNPDGQSATLASAFTYGGPRIDSVTPATGSTAGGTTITISGAGFLTGATVKVDGSSASNVVVVSATTITASTPVGPADASVSTPRDVVVTNPDGSSATKTGAFTYFVPTLSVISISPVAGGTGGGTTVTITGTGFTTTLSSSVTFGGVAGTNVRVIDAVTLQVTAPAHALGPVDVVVTVGASSVTKTNAFTYQLVPPRRRAVRH